MNSWKLIKTGTLPKLRKPILIEGLPGIGNVGKVAVDFIIEELNAKKVCELISHSMPNSVFVNEDNLVELPSISIYFKKSRDRDILFVAGDAQPIDEVSCYEFSETILDFLQAHKGREVITLGGIGLPNVPKKPKVYCTGTSKEFIDTYAKDGLLEPKLYGIVGPIIGISGLLLGIAKRKKMDGISLLAETYGHPFYLGIRGAREIVRVLNKKLSLQINMKQLDKEIQQLESEAAKKSKYADLQRSARGISGQDANYIG